MFMYEWDTLEYHSNKILCFFLMNLIIKLQVPYKNKPKPDQVELFEMVDEVSSMRSCPNFMGELLLTGRKGWLTEMGVVCI